MEKSKKQFRIIKKKDIHYLQEKIPFLFHHYWKTLQSSPYVSDLETDLTKIDK